MGHYIQTIIARDSSFSSFLEVLPGALSVPANQGFVFIPVNDNLLDQWFDVFDEVLPFELLSESLATCLLKFSNYSPIAYIETEYFGGTGTQMAMAWSEGSVVVEPRSSDTTWDASSRSYAVSNGQPINFALKRIGVRSEGALDEFDSIGLGNHRDFDDIYG